jgi:hypothetical protein
MFVCKINILIIVGAILVLDGFVCTNTSFSASAQTSMEIMSGNTSINDTYISQKTEMSVPASPMVTPPGKLPHQTVFALPLRDDGKIWTGVVTFTASKPIEIEVLHNYDPNILPDAQHGEPYHATLPTNQTIALSTMTMFTETPVRLPIRLLALVLWRSLEAHWCFIKQVGNLLQSHIPSMQLPKSLIINNGYCN